MITTMCILAAIALAIYFMRRTARSPSPSPKINKLIEDILNTDSHNVRWDDIDLCWSVWVNGVELDRYVYKNLTWGDYFRVLRARHLRIQRDKREENEKLRRKLLGD